MFDRFLASGIAIAGIDVGESYGSPDGRSAFSVFYQTITEEHALCSRPCLLARSRGGLMLYNWAAEHPDSVSGIAGIYPVCDLRSYPGLAEACGAYGISIEALSDQLADHNPVNRLSPLADAGIPIHHIHGDSDTVVPLENNSGVMLERYTGIGGVMRLENVAGRGHDMWEGWFRSQALVDFVKGVCHPS